MLELFIKKSNFKFVSHFIFNTLKVSSKHTSYHSNQMEIVYRKLQNVYL